MSSKRKKELSKELNAEYFKVFIATRGSIGSLYLSIPGLAIGLICTVMTWSIASWSYNMNPLHSRMNLSMMGIVAFMLLTFLGISFNSTRNLLTRHQAFATGWLTALSVFLGGVLVFLSYTMVQGNDGNNFSYETKLSKSVLMVFGVVYLLVLVYNFWWLKKQLRRGFSEKRAVANYFAGSQVYSSKSIWFIFGCAMVVSFLTGNLTRFLGFIGGIFFEIAFSRLTVELGYATYLLSQGQDYWVMYPETPSQPWREQIKTRFSKLSTYVILGIIILAGIPQIEQFYDVPDYVHLVLVYLSKGILLGLALAFITWCIKKIKK